MSYIVFYPLPLIVRDYSQNVAVRLGHMKMNVKIPARRLLPSL